MAVWGFDSCEVTVFRTPSPPPNALGMFRDNTDAESPSDKEFLSLYKLTRQMALVIKASYATFFFFFFFRAWAKLISLRDNNLLALD